MRWKCAELDELDLALARVVPPETVTVEGQWASSRRGTYRHEDSRPGVGPFLEVLDWTWKGTLVGADPLAAIVFLEEPAAVHWVKSARVASSLPVNLSLHAYADHSSKVATFAASVGDDGPPAVPVADTGSPAETCEISAGPFVTGRVAVLARTEGADLLVLLFPARLVKIGRNRLWRLRDQYAAELPPRLREVLTRRRTGILSVAPGRRTVG